MTFTLLISSLALLGLGGLLGFRVGRAKAWRKFVISMLVGVGLFAASMLYAHLVGGYQGLGIFLLTAALILPLELGGLIGAGIAALRNRRTRET